MISPEQREQRRKYIGSSDVACLVGVDPWRNAGDLWLEKTGRLIGDKSSTAADLGTDMEGAILNMFERRMGVTTERNIFLSREAGFPACANLDGAVREWGEPKPSEFGLLTVREKAIKSVVEAKSTSQQDEWNEHTGEVPLRVLCQTQWQMWVAGCDLAYVPALFPDFGRFRLEVYQVERNDALIVELVGRAERFWSDHVLRDTPPADVVPHLESLKRIRRAPQSTVSLDEDAAGILQALEAAKAQRKACEIAVEQHQSELLALLGDAEAGSLPDGSSITYLEQNGARRCDFDLLEAELRALGKFEIYERLVRQSRFRVLRHKKAKRR